MVKILMHGCNGAMGQVISNLALENEEAKIVAGVDISGESKNDYPVFTSLEACDVPVDVIIDFSTAKAVDGLLDYVAAKKIPVVLCTTGLSEDQIAKTKEVSKEVAVLKSANMSLGVNTVFKLAAMAAQILASKGYDMEIVEKHEQRLGRGNIEFAVISTKLNIIMAILAAVGVAVCGAVISIIL